MKKMKTYNIPEPKETSSLREPEIASHVSLPVMSRAEALEHGMPLAESRRILFEKIRQDFED